MRVAIARTMPEFSMDVYAENLVAGLRAVRPDWEIVELFPAPIDRKSRSSWVRVQKYYERYWHFPQQVARQAADIVHIIDAAEAHIAYWLQTTDTRTVVTCHDLINYFYSDNRVASVQLPFVSHQMWLHGIRGMRCADRIVAVSTATAKDAIEILNLDPSHVVVAANGVEPIFTRLPADRSRSIRQQYGIPPDVFCLLNVGSDHRRKNLLAILKSLAIVKQMGISCIFCKVGSPFTAEQEQLIDSLELTDIVRYLGKPDRQAVVEIYNAADVLVAPSLFEGFGMTILEAMACGTPAISSNVSSMPEVVGDAGILVDPHSPPEIAQAIDRLYRDPQLYQALSTAGIIRARSFTWQHTAQKIATTYETLVRDRHR